jgi:riboflavin kinase/FMN adenylyltransferase
MKKPLVDLPLTLTGRVIPGRGVGRTLGFPTANLDRKPAKLPDGVYAGYATTVNGSIQRADALIYWGKRPTFVGADRAFEVYLIDQAITVRASELTVHLTHYLRPDQAFASSAELIEHMHRDVADARKILH